ncbi:MAG: hypothetical protein REJ24_02040 [Rhodocyclaceae bacterium]|nr:hypothetical protein [Pseudomonadota bacterium]MDQ7971315.1 hypothetical protein [Rhodocyclaceae bacterium]MDQ7998951.1 hypothetical protein [Pseudomonadota bacterium]
MHRPLSPRRRGTTGHRSRQGGQTITEYVVVAGILAVMLFAPMPGADRSVIALLIKAFKDAWAAYSYTISFPW